MKSLFAWLHFASIVLLIALLLNGACWIVLHRFVHRLPAPWRLGLRIALGCFMALEVSGILWISLPRLLWHTADHIPGRFLPSLFYLWNLLTLPLVAAFLLVAGAIRQTYKQARRWLARMRNAPPAPPADLGRRQFLFRSGAALLPAVSTLGMTVAAYLQLPYFRTNRLDVPIPDLPLPLDGLRIAHVSDFHTGRFIDADHLARIVAAVNGLDADLIAFTGDLIDYSLEAMPDSLAALRALRSRHGLWFCEGNHDLYYDGDEFRRQCRASGLNFLLDASQVVEIRGVPVELIGLRWASTPPPAPIPWRGDTFPILLAHHPHIFDAAVRDGIPLTLSGHTHGGQLMLTEKIGCGPLFFNYWSGLYARENCRLVVSNGAGNWFPLRINAPAEIALLTLRRT